MIAAAALLSNAPPSLGVVVWSWWWWWWEVVWRWEVAAQPNSLEAVVGCRDRARPTRGKVVAEGAGWSRATHNL